MFILNTILFCRLVAENEKVRARNLYLESKSLDSSFKETVTLSGKGKSNINVTPKKLLVSKFSVDDAVTDMHTSVSTDSLDKMMERADVKEVENEEEEASGVLNRTKNSILDDSLDVGNGNEVEAEVEFDINVLEGGRSARLCAKLKKVAQEKEVLRQVSNRNKYHMLR
jgi:hypothetical protein